MGPVAVVRNKQYFSDLVAQAAEFNHSSVRNFQEQEQKIFAEYQKRANRSAQQMQINDRVSGAINLFLRDKAEVAVIGRAQKDQSGEFDDVVAVINRGDFTGKRYIVIPDLRSVHFTSIVVDIHNAKIEVANSMGSGSNNAENLQILLACLNDKFKTTFQPKQPQHQILQQTDGTSCGWHTVLNSCLAVLMKTGDLRLMKQVASYITGDEFKDGSFNDLQNDLQQFYQSATRDQKLEMEQRIIAACEVNSASLENTQEYLELRKKDSAEQRKINKVLAFLELVKEGREFAAPEDIKEKAAKLIKDYNHFQGLDQSYWNTHNAASRSLPQLPDYQYQISPVVSESPLFQAFYQEVSKHERSEDFPVNTKTAQDILNKFNDSKTMTNLSDSGTEHSFSETEEEYLEEETNDEEYSQEETKDEGYSEEEKTKRTVLPQISAENSPQQIFNREEFDEIRQKLKAAQQDDEFKVLGEKILNFVKYKHPVQQSEMLKLLVDDYLQTESAKVKNILLAAVSALINQGALQQETGRGRQVAFYIVEKLEGKEEHVLKNILVHDSARSGCALKAFAVFIENFGFHDANLLDIDGEEVKTKGATISKIIADNNLEALDLILSRPAQECDQELRNHALRDAILANNHFAIDKCLDKGADIFCLVQQNKSLFDFIPNLRKNDVLVRAFTGCVYHKDPAQYAQFLLQQDPKLAQYGSSGSHILIEALRFIKNSADEKDKQKARDLINHLTSGKHKAIPNWTKIEKPILFHAIASGDSASIEILMRNISSQTLFDEIIKTDDEGQNIFDYFKKEELRLFKNQEFEDQEREAFADSRKILQQKILGFLHGEGFVNISQDKEAYTISKDGHKLNSKDKEAYTISKDGHKLNSNEAIEQEILNILRIRAQDNSLVTEKFETFKSKFYGEQEIKINYSPLNKEQTKQLQEQIVCHAIKEITSAIDTEIDKKTSKSNKKAAAQKREKAYKRLQEILIAAPDFSLLTKSQYADDKKIIDLAVNKQGKELKGLRNRLLDINLFAASKKASGRQQALKALIDAGATARHFTDEKDWKNALDNVLEDGDAESARFLLSTKASASLPVGMAKGNAEIKTPQQKAIKQGEEKKEIKSPLQKAIEQGNVKAVSLLIEAQAVLFNPAGTGDKGQDEYKCWALDLAKEQNLQKKDKNSEEILRLLQQEYNRQLFVRANALCESLQGEEIGLERVNNKVIKLRLSYNNIITLTVAPQPYGDHVYNIESSEQGIPYDDISKIILRKEKEFEDKKREEIDKKLTAIVAAHSDKKSAKKPNKEEAIKAFDKFINEEKNDGILTLAFSRIIAQLNADRTAAARRWKIFANAIRIGKYDLSEQLTDAQKAPLEAAAKKILDKKIEITPSWQRERSAVESRENPNVRPLIQFLQDGDAQMQERLLNYALLKAADTPALNAPYFREICNNKKYRIFSDDADAAENNNVDDKGNNPLHLAFKNGNLDIIQEILSHEQDWKKLLKQQNHEGETPLMVAARYNQHKAIQFFCEDLQAKKEDKYLAQAVNIKGGQGKTPLMTAASYGALGATKTLLEFGANKEIKSKESKIAEEYVKERKSKTISDEIYQEIYRRLAEGRQQQIVPPSPRKKALDPEPKTKTKTKTEKELIKPDQLQFIVALDDIATKNNIRVNNPLIGERINWYFNNNLTRDAQKYKTAREQEKQFQPVAHSGDKVLYSAHYHDKPPALIKDEAMYVCLKGEKAKEYNDEYNKSGKKYFQPYYMRFYNKIFRDQDDKKIFGGANIFMASFNNCDLEVDLSGVLDTRYLFQEEQNKTTPNKFSEEQILETKFTTIRSLRFHNCDVTKVTWPQREDGLKILPNAITFSPDLENSKKRADFFKMLDGWIKEQSEHKKVYEKYKELCYIQSENVAAKTGIESGIRLAPNPEIALESARKLQKSIPKQIQ